MVSLVVFVVAVAGCPKSDTEEEGAMPFDPTTPPPPMDMGAPAPGGEAPPAPTGAPAPDAAAPDMPPVDVPGEHELPPGS